MVLVLDKNSQDGTNFEVVKRFGPNCDNKDFKPELVFLGVRHQPSEDNQVINYIKKHPITTPCKFFVERRMDQEVSVIKTPFIKELPETVSVQGWDDPEHWERSEGVKKLDYLYTVLNNFSKFTDRVVNIAIEALREIYNDYVASQPRRWFGVKKSVPEFPSPYHQSSPDFRKSMTSLNNALEEFRRRLRRQDYKKRHDLLCKMIEEEAPKGKSIWVAGSLHFSRQKSEQIPDTLYRECVDSFYRSVEKTGKSAVIIIANAA